MILDAPIPPDGIGLADAFQRVCVVRLPEWPVIQAELEAASEALREAMAGRTVAAAAEWRPMGRLERQKRRHLQRDKWQQLQKLRENAQNRLFDAKCHADRIFREALAAREIRALIRNPATGEVAEITNSNEWKIDAAGLGLPASELYEPGFSVNHVSEWRRPNQEGRRVLLVNPMPEQPGPPSHFGDGVRCPVFLPLEDFERWLLAHAAGEPGAKSFTPYPDPNVLRLSKKPALALEQMKKIWPNGSPDHLSAKSIADRLNKIPKVGSKLDGRGKQINSFNEDDVKWALGRKKR